MVRVSDARMSGTAFGTVVLHASPEASVGGNISFVRDGDIISLDVIERTISVNVSDEELEKRKEASWSPPSPPRSGYALLFHDSIEGEPSCREIQSSFTSALTSLICMSRSRAWSRLCLLERL